MQVEIYCILPTNDILICICSEYLDKERMLMEFTIQLPANENLNLVSEFLCSVCSVSVTELWDPLGVCRYYRAVY